MGKKSKRVKDGDQSGEEEKPLPKLVLKVAKEDKGKRSLVEVEDRRTGSESEGHFHHKKKKKKHRHSKNEEVAERKSRKREHQVEATECEPPVKKILIKVPTREKEKLSQSQELDVSPLRLCLENLHRTLQRKDVNGIFAFPVTDSIAPGYSSIIKNPMDFLTMLRKIETDKYESMQEMKSDFELMCRNAMTYNGSDTIYYQQAAKMLAYGLKVLSKERIRTISKGIGLPDEGDGDARCGDKEEVAEINVEDTHEPDTCTSPRKATSETKKRRDILYHPSITESVLEAARLAREKLFKKHPAALYGYLSKDGEGSTHLNVLNPDAAGGDTRVPVTLGSIAGKLTSGISPAQGASKEDKKSKVTPVNYLFYGPYGTFGPSHDSSIATLTKEESDLLLSTYGTELGGIYATSMTSFVKDASRATVDQVDRFLDVITEGAHSKYKRMQKEKLASQPGDKENLPKHQSPHLYSSCEQQFLDVDESSTGADTAPAGKEDAVDAVDVESLLSLDSDGIDVSFLKDMFKGSSAREKGIKSYAPEKLDKARIASPQGMLSINTDLLKELSVAQSSRLSQKLGGLAPIPEAEQSIAASLTGNLKELIGKVQPADVVSQAAVRNALGLAPIAIDLSSGSDSTAPTRR